MTLYTDIDSVQPVCRNNPEQGNIITINQVKSSIICLAVILIILLLFYNHDPAVVASNDTTFIHFSSTNPDFEYGISDYSQFPCKFSWLRIYEYHKVRVDTDTITTKIINRDFSQLKFTSISGVSGLDDGIKESRNYITTIRRNGIDFVLKVSIAAFEKTSDTSKLATITISVDNWVFENMDNRLAIEFIIEGAGVWSSRGLSQERTYLNKTFIVNGYRKWINTTLVYSAKSNSLVHVAGGGRGSRSDHSHARVLYLFSAFEDPMNHISVLHISAGDGGKIAGNETEMTQVHASKLTPVAVEMLLEYKNLGKINLSPVKVIFSNNQSNHVILFIQG